VKENLNLGTIHAIYTFGELEELGVDLHF